MASRNKDERAFVNVLIEAIQKNSPKTYVHIDRDCGSLRHTSSGWDFLLALDGCVVFCEAKIKTKLSPWQLFTQALIKNSNTKYVVVRFTPDGEFFTLDNKKVIAISDATFEDFIQG